MRDKVRIVEVIIIRVEKRDGSVTESHPFRDIFSANMFLELLRMRPNTRRAELVNRIERVTI